MNKPTIIFDKSVSKEIFNMLNVKGQKCQKCGKLLIPNNFAGFINKKPICKDILCLFDVVMTMKDNAIKEGQR